MAIAAINSTSLGTPAAGFHLPDVVSGKSLDLAQLPPTPALLIVFLCRHCPYVIHLLEDFLRVARDYQPKGLQIVAICSNDASRFPDDAPDKLREMALERQFPFPLLHDESQETARTYDALCTPDFFLFDQNRKLAYRGRFDDSTPGNGNPVTGRDLREALDAVLAGRPAPAEQKPSMGCSIKWRQ